MHLNSELLFRKYARQLFRNGMRVLEVGPDHFPSSYQQIVNDSTIKWETLDIYPSEKLTYVAADEYDFPLPSDTFDVVLTGQVIEHVKKIWSWMRELARVCKSGGFVVTINPVSYPYHEAPVDCWRIYPEGMRALYGDAGLRTELSVFESLEPRLITLPVCLLKQFARLCLGRPLGHCSFSRNIDTISIGRKQ